MFPGDLHRDDYNRSIVQADHKRDLWVFVCEKTFSVSYITVLRYGWSTDIDSAVEACLRAFLLIHLVEIRAYR